MRKIMIGLLTSAGLLATPAIAAGSPATTTMDVTATVNAVCNVMAHSLDFGTISSTDNDVISSTPGKLMVTCSDTTPYTVTADTPAGGQRAMKGTKEDSATLDYGIFTDSTGTTTFPTADEGTPIGQTGNGLTQEIDVYGKVPQGTTIPAPDTYSDQITFTVAY